MSTAIGVLVLVLGCVYPIAGLFWLHGRVSRQPVLTPRQLGLVLAFNWFLPVVLILAGLGLLIPHLWDMLAFKVVLALAALSALATLTGLMWTTSGSRKENT